MCFPTPHKLLGHHTSMGWCPGNGVGVNTAGWSIWKYGWFWRQCSLSRWVQAVYKPARKENSFSGQNSSSSRQVVTIWNSPPQIKMEFPTIDDKKGVNGLHTCYSTIKTSRIWLPWSPGLQGDPKKFKALQVVKLPRQRETKFLGAQTWEGGRAPPIWNNKKTRLSQNMWTNNFFPPKRIGGWHSLL